MVSSGEPGSVDSATLSCERRSVNACRARGQLGARAKDWRAYVAELLCEASFDAL